MDMMINRNMEQLKEAAKRDILAQLEGNWKVQENEVTKNNTTLTGLVFIKDNASGGPTIYVEDICENIDSGEPYEAVVSQMAESISNSSEMFSAIAAKFDVSDYESIKDRLETRLIGTDLNKDFLNNLVYYEVCSGLALVPDIVNYVTDGELRARVTRGIAGEFGVSDEEIISKALENSQKKNPPCLVPMSESIFASPGACMNLLNFDTLPYEYEEEGMYVLSNNDLSNGACVLFYPGVTDKINDLIGDFFVLPSSVHEIIIVPATGRDPEVLAELIRNANRSVVAGQDILSDHLYICREGKGVERYMPKELS